MAVRSKRMKVVLKLAIRREEEYAKAMGLSRSQLEQQQSRLTELNDYQQEYRQQKSRLGSGVAGAQALQNLMFFLQNLEQAIIQQQLVVKNSEQQLSSIQREWQKNYARRKKLQELVERYQFEESIVLEKRLQKELDDQSIHTPKSFQ